MNTQKIQFQQIRDFGQVFNAGFAFMRGHFFRIFRYLLSIGGPFLLVGVGVTALLMIRMQSWTTSVSKGSVLPFAWTDFGITYLVNLLSFFVGFVMITAVINAYIKLYIESPEVNPDIQLGEVWSQVKKDFFRLAGQLLLVSVFIFGLNILFLVLPGLLGTGMTSVGIVLLGFFIGFGLFIFLMPYVVGVLITQIYFGKTSFLKNIARTFSLVQGNWWITFGLGFVNTIIMSTVFFICFFPFYLIMIISMVSQMSSNPGQTPDFSSMTVVIVAMIVFMTLGYMATFIIHNVMAAVHYFNLEERKGGGGLLTKIQSIGSGDNSLKSPVDFYDEEEKY
ncbi:hypothetical protein QNI19_22190 [Cytophagaceae bacterium DM2B3-1]|uniref:Glycerophosphoryl diester phosphodiesterase membrane domain-containing protein n=1 Tax=Xanthocytophaga flava TaxID=3048013 RepID=A0ABT7CPJ6_9BACT|nr:hypothetical protein [Xanthocytophaga flavus]MDJ1495662.1 hypothetical protein [Xanthocytophaga flavus]